MNEENKNTAGIEDEKTLFEEYGDLLVKRDALIKETETIMITYIKEFGAKTLANFELKINCIKIKKTISYCRRRLNRGLVIDPDRMQKDIEKEMQHYYAELRGMTAEKEAADKSKLISPYKASLSKKIYRRLAKLLHPDINKKTEQNEDLMNLWTRIVDAYESYDIDRLQELEVLVRRAMEALGEEGFEIDSTDLSERIERLEEQINIILTTEPYTYREIVSNDEKIREYNEQLDEEHAEYEEYKKSLERTLDGMLKEGGATILWHMN